MPGRVEAATVDHRLRPEAAAEAAQVGGICRSRGIPHETLKAVVSGKGGLQAGARIARYEALSGWCSHRGLELLATAHHVNDQAETLLMRLARGSGVEGMGGVRPYRLLSRMPDRRTGQGADISLHLVRPLLDFTAQELALIARKAGLEPVDDPSNRDTRFDRTRARELLATTDWLEPRRLAAVTSHMRDAAETLEWATDHAYRTRVEWKRHDFALFDPTGLPADLLRRVVRELLDQCEEIGTEGEWFESDASGPELTRLIERVQAGVTSTLGQAQVRGGATWKFRALTIFLRRR